MLKATTILSLATAPLLLAGGVMIAPPAKAQAPAPEPAAAATSPEQRVAILRAALHIGMAYRIWNGAAARKDVATLTDWATRHTTEKFTLRRPDGKLLTREQYIASLGDAAVPQKKIELRVTGDIASVLARCSYAASAAGAGEATPRPPASRDTWVKSGDDWKLQSSEELAEAPPPAKPASSR